LQKLHGRIIETVRESPVETIKTPELTITKSKRTKVIGWIKFGLAVAILLILVYWIRWDDLIQSLMTARFEMLLLALALLIPNILAQGLRWGYLLRRQTSGVPHKEIVASLFLGWTLGILTPGRVGQFARAFAVPSAPTLPTIGLTIVDKLFTLVWIVLFGAVGFFSFFAVPPGVSWIWIPLAISIIWLALSPQMLNRLLQRICRVLPFREKLLKIISTLEHLNTRDCVVAHVFSIVTVATFFSQFVFLVSAFFPILYMDGMRATAAVVFVKSALPITFGELGVGEAASIHFFGQFGVTKAAAFNASILTFFINLVIPSLIGLLFLPSLRLYRNNKVSSSS
jgi:uncharacterized membrane protein YbhN (UPF0104 family)